MNGWMKSLPLWSHDSWQTTRCIADILHPQNEYSWFNVVHSVRVNDKFNNVTLKRKFSYLRYICILCYRKKEPWHVFLRIRWVKCTFLYLDLHSAEFKYEHEKISKKEFQPLYWNSWSDNIVDNQTFNLFKCLI